MKKLSSLNLDYRMPAEWEPHASTWLTWPENNSTWSGSLLKEVQAVYLQIIQALLGSEKVNLLVKDEKKARMIVQRLNPKKSAGAGLVFHEVPTADVWIRDYGPIFVKSSRKGAYEKAFTKWVFNAWGGKYKDLIPDNGVVDELPALHGYRRFDAEMVLEGGSIDVNGKGTCLATEECLLNRNRNPKLTRRQIEKALGSFLGIKKVIWLKKGIKGDDTDGHVDEVARFVGPSIVLVATEADATDQNYRILKENLEILKRATDQNGKRLRMIELPMPEKAMFRKKGSAQDRLPASYANFYIGNKVVLVPAFHDKNDRPAQKILKSLFPKRKVVPIPCAALARGKGLVHCITQQEPA